MSRAVIIRGGVLDGLVGEIVAWVGGRPRVYVAGVGVFDLDPERVWVR